MVSILGLPRDKLTGAAVAGPRRCLPSPSQLLLALGLAAVVCGLYGSAVFVARHPLRDIASAVAAADDAAAAALDILRKPASPSSSSSADLQRATNAPAAAHTMAPRSMIGIFMIDTPEAKLQRTILRVIYPPQHVVLRFVLCRPTAATALEADVVALDMEENMNEGKTHRWFEYAVTNLPPSVTAVFKLDTDAIFCITKLQKLMLEAESKSAYSYVGTFMNHAACSPSGFVHCPPAHCNENNKFVGDCWYYMSGGFYGFSVPLLREIARTPLFLSYSNGPQESHHEDVMSGRWVNQTVSRNLVSEERFDYFHAKWLVQINPPRMDNYFKSYFLALKERGCAKEAESVKAEFELMYANTQWKPNATEIFK